MTVITTLANATDIAAWANKKTAQDQLPKLVRRLIRSTSGQVRLISFRADEGTQLGGFDGILEVGTGDEFVPSGKSFWEFGASKQPKSKADDDYEKRTRNPPPDVEPAEAAFVFVTPRRWSNKDEWARARNAEGIWREVRAYDADDLETWLESAPAVHVWLSTLLGKYPEGAIDIEGFWDDWSRMTAPHLSAELVTAGRDAAVAHIHEWLRGAPVSLALRAESNAEAIAFFAAALHSLPPEEIERAFSTCLVVENIAAWRRLTASDEPLILIPSFPERDSVARATQNDHHVLTPLGNDVAELPSTLSIPRLDRAHARRALVGMGVSDERADELATLARRSFLALRRKLSLNPAVQVPAWAVPSEARKLLPALLVGGWSDSNEKDRAAMARLGNAPYETISDTLVRWANEPDPPVRRVGDTWLVASREDSWSLLARYLTRRDLEVFESVVLEALGCADAKFDLTPDERWRAALLVERTRHSDLMSDSVAETLTIMAARGGAVGQSGAVSGQEFADRVVGELLRRANEDQRLWSSLAYRLPLLSEAAPVVFLDAVETGLLGEHPVLLGIFAEGSSPMSSSSPHTGLLWALELLAWHPDHLAHAALLLAKLARLDPGGKLLNRPHRSLREIFLCWHPRTTGGLDKRLGVIDSIRTREPQIAWRLLCALLPKAHDVSHPTSAPRWREWLPESKHNQSVDEWQRAVGALVERLLSDVGADGGRWSDLIKRLADLPDAERNAIIDGLAGLDVAGLAARDRLEIWTALRETISYHREHQDFDWAMPAELTDEMEKLYERFTPDDIVDRYAWLFSHKAKLVKPLAFRRSESRLFHEDRGNLIEAHRRAAIEMLFGAGKLRSLIAAAERADRPDLLGSTFGKIGLLDSDEDDLLREHLASPEPPTASFAKGFAIARFEDEGWQWATDKLASRSARRWSPEQRADFLACLPFGGRTWDIADSFGEETRSAYWARVGVGYPSADDAERAMRSLIEHKRPQDAVEFLSLSGRRGELPVPAPLVAEVLTQLLVVSKEVRIDWNSLGHWISDLIGSLAESGAADEMQVALLEWHYMPVLEDYGGPKLLRRELSRNPDLFAEVVSHVYAAEDNEDGETSGHDLARAALGHKLLETWRGCPGLREDGSIDAESLRSWVARARQKLREMNRGIYGDVNIGRALAFAPHGSDGAFPHEAVRELLEELADTQIESALEIKIFNNRGVVTRSLTEGGVQERRIAEMYAGYAAVIGDRHPRTAAVLRRLAQRYYRDAARQDLRGELRQDMWR